MAFPAALGKAKTSQRELQQRRIDWCSSNLRMPNVYRPTTHEIARGARLAQVRRGSHPRTMRFGLRTVRGAGGGAAGQASSRILATVAAHALSVCLLTTNGLSGGLLPPAYAGSAPLNEEQKLAASAWKETDRIFVDRTFGDQDWFKRREKLLKATKTGGREDTYDAIREMLKSVDDKYTRFLTPAMYDAVYSVATGDVAGVGCELAAEPRADGKGTEITFTTIFEGSPAEAAGVKAGAVLSMPSFGFRLGAAKRVLSGRAS